MVRVEFLPVQPVSKERLCVTFEHKRARESSSSFSKRGLLFIFLSLSNFCVTKRTPKNIFHKTFFSCRSYLHLFDNFSPVRSFLKSDKQPLFLIEILKSFIYILQIYCMIIFHTIFGFKVRNICPKLKMSIISLTKLDRPVLIVDLE